MALHEQHKASAAEDKAKAAALARQSELSYEQRVVAAEAKVAAPTYFGRRKVDWYT